MAYEIKTHGPQPVDGIRAKEFNKPNFPPNYKAGSAEAVWGTDLLSDPTDAGVTDPTSGYNSPGTRVSEA